MNKTNHKGPSLRGIYNAAAFTCALSLTLLGGTFIKAEKDYGPPSQFKDMEQRQINDVHNALRCIFAPLALVAGAVALGAKRKQSPSQAPS